MIKNKEHLLVMPLETSPQPSPQEREQYRQMKNLLMKHLAFVFIGMTFHAATYAQATRDTVKNLGDEDVYVVKAYQPTLSDAVKISDMPGADTATFADPDFKYTIDPKKIETNFNSTPIKPVKIKDDNIKLLNKGYVKAGYGTKNTPYIEAYYNALRSKEFDAGVHLKHLSSTGPIKNYGQTDNSNSGLELFGKKYGDLGTLRAGLDLNRNMVHYYGYDREQTIYSKAETKQVFSGVGGNVGFDNMINKDAEWKFDAGLSFYAYSGKRDTNKTNESNIVFDGLLKKKIYEKDASAALKIDYVNTKMPFFEDYQSTIIGLYPRYTFDLPTFRFIVGLNTELETGRVNEFHIYPHAEARYKLASDILMIHAQITGGMERNTYKSMTAENPFTNDLVFPGNTNNKVDVSGGLNVKLDKEIIFTADVRYNRLTNAMYFVNDSASALDYTTFSNVYDDANVFTLHGELQFERNEQFTTHVGATYTNNKPDSLANAWFVPALELNLGGNIIVQDKIIFKTDMFYRGERFAPGYAGVESVKLKGYFDANIGCEYRYSKMLSVFLNVNNIGSVQYFNWYNYPSYRFQVLGGLALSF